MMRDYLIYTAAGAIRALAQEEDGGVTSVIQRILAILGEDEAPQAPQPPQATSGDAGGAGATLPQVNKDTTRAAKSLREEVLAEIADLVKDWPDGDRTVLREEARKAGLDPAALEALRARARKMAEERRKPAKGARKSEAPAPKGGSDDLGIF